LKLLFSNALIRDTEKYLTTRVSNVESYGLPAGFPAPSFFQAVKSQAFKANIQRNKQIKNSLASRLEEWPSWAITISSHGSVSIDSISYF